MADEEATPNAGKQKSFGKGFRTFAQNAAKGIHRLDSRAGESADSLGGAAGKQCAAGGTMAMGAAKNVGGKVSGQFDVLSGQAMYEAVQERLAKQDHFNDVLANKLFEALERVEELEKLLERFK